MINQGNWQGILEVMSCLLVSYACDIGPLAIHSVVENVASRLYKKQVSLEPQFSIWKPCWQRIAIKVPGRWGAGSPTGWATACDQTPTGLTDLTIDTFTSWIVFSHYVEVIGMLWFWLWSCFIGFWARMRFAQRTLQFQHTRRNWISCILSTKCSQKKLLVFARQVLLLDLKKG